MNRVVVHLRRRDLLRAQFQMILRLRIWWLLFVACLATSGYYLADSTPRPAIAIGIAAALLTALLFTAAAVLLVYLIVAPLMLVKLNRAPGVRGKHTFEITAEGLREITEVSEIRVAAGYARRLIRTRAYIIVLVSRRGAFVMPRRDFDDATAYAEFWKALQPLAASKEKRRVA